jgi:hypothetical protein
MNIFDIDREIQALFDPETGELVDEAAFDQLAMERDEKIKRTALYYKAQAKLAKDIQEEIRALQERQRVAKNKAERTKELLEYALQGEKFVSPEVEVTYRKSVSLDVEDEAAVIEWAKETGNLDCLKVPTVTISANDVKALLKSGVDIPGASLLEHRNIGVK